MCLDGGRNFLDRSPNDPELPSSSSKKDVTDGGHLLIYAEMIAGWALSAYWDGKIFGPKLQVLRGPAVPPVQDRSSELSASRSLDQSSGISGSDHSRCSGCRASIDLAKSSPVESLPVSPPLLSFLGSGKFAAIIPIHDEALDNASVHCYCSSL